MTPAEVSSPVGAGRTDTVGDVHQGTTLPDTGLPEIRFVRHLPGFPGLSRYALIDLGQAGTEPVLFELRSLERPEIRFMVGVPGAFFPDYEIELDAVSCEERVRNHESGSFVSVDKRMIANDAKGVGGGEVDEGRLAMSEEVPWFPEGRFEKANISDARAPAKACQHFFVNCECETLPNPNRLLHFANSFSVCR